MNTHEAPHPQLERLSRMLRTRRLELGLKQTELKNRGGPSAETVGKFEAGEISAQVQPRTLEGFDRALQWRTGSTRAVLDGGDPTPLYVGDENRPEQPRPVWIPVPRCVIQDISIAAARLSILARVDQNLPDELRKAVRHLHLLAADMNALLAASERYNDDLQALMDSNAPLDTYTGWIENLAGRRGPKNGDVQR